LRKALTRRARMEDGKSIEIKIYLLERTDTAMSGEVSKMVVAGPSEKSAREIANAESGTEGYVWTDGHLTSAKLIGIATDAEGVILESRE